MSYFVLYRKPAFHKNYPWDQHLKTSSEVVKFIEDLGKEYDFRVFQEITVADVYETKE